jgi:thioredoxin 1
MMKVVRSRVMTLSLLAMLTGTLLIPAWAAKVMDTPSLPKEFKRSTPGLKVTLLEFSAPWCASCVKLKPAVDKLEKEIGSRLNVVDLNITKPETQKYIEMYNLTSVPAYFLYDAAGKPIERIEREITPEELRSLVMKASR